MVCKCLVKHVLSGQTDMAISSLSYFHELYWNLKAGNASMTKKGNLVFCRFLYKGTLLHTHLALIQRALISRRWMEYTSTSLQDEK